jgi:hypothetical protein
VLKQLYEKVKSIKREGNDLPGFSRHFFSHTYVRLHRIYLVSIGWIVPSSFSQTMLRRFTDFVNAVTDLNNIQWVIRYCRDESARQSLRKHLKLLGKKTLLYVKSIILSHLIQLKKQQFQKVQISIHVLFHGKA